MTETEPKRKVLIVDDVAEMRATLRAVVRTLGCTVLEASSGVQAGEA